MLQYGLTSTFPAVKIDVHYIPINEDLYFEIMILDVSVNACSNKGTLFSALDIVSSVIVVELIMFYVCVSLNIGVMLQLPSYFPHCWKIPARLQRQFVPHKLQRQVLL